MAATDQGLNYDSEGAARPTYQAFLEMLAR